jgi:hypothetical protein
MPRKGAYGATAAPALLPFGIDISGFNFATMNEVVAPLHVDHRTPRTKESADALPPLAWAQKYRRIKGRPFTLSRHKPLEQIYNDDHPHIVVMKPAQVGISELTLTRTMWALDVGAQYWGIEQDGINVAYLFPTETALRDFSKERFAKLRRENDYLEQLFTDYDDVTFKQAGDSFLYLRGASSPTQLLSFPADLLILDEYDRMPEESISLARQRLRASSVKREIDISTPTLPAIGIDAAFQQSDQNVWQVHCARCGGWVEMDFFNDVRLNDTQFSEWSEWEVPAIRKAVIAMHCPECTAQIDPFAEGRWHTRFPDRTSLRGYHVPWYAFPAVNVHTLCIDSVSPNPTRRVEFFRSGLGLPYSESGSHITEEMLHALCASIPNGIPKNITWRKTVMGVDVGAVFHYQVRSLGSDGYTYVRMMGKARTLAELDLIIRQFKVRRVVVDGQPETHLVNEWMVKHRGRVIKAYYTTGPRQQVNVLLKHDVKLRKVTINRTMGMDLVYAGVAEGNERWPKDVVHNREIVINMTAPVRMEKLDEHGQAFATWEHTAPDHGFHAALYATCASMLGTDTIPGVIGQAATKGWSP